MTVQNILFPVDFSRASVATAPLVKGAGSIASAKVTLLHVLEPSASGFELMARPLKEVQEDLKIVAREKLNFVWIELCAGGQGHEWEEL